MSPLDEHYPNTSPSYETYLRNQLSELLTNYGPIAELYLPGNYADASVNWSGLWALAKQLQPDVVIFAGPPLPASGTDIRFLGNQSGQATRATSSVAPFPDAGPADVWYPAEAPVSDRGLDWFWHANGTVISVTSLQAMFFHTVGMNTTLSVNVPPAATGQFDTADVELLQQFGDWYGSAFKTNLAHGQLVFCRLDVEHRRIRRNARRRRRHLQLLGGCQRHDVGAPGSDSSRGLQHHQHPRTDRAWRANDRIPRRNQTEWGMESQPLGRVWDGHRGHRHRPAPTLAGQSHDGGRCGAGHRFSKGCSGHCRVRPLLTEARSDFVSRLGPRGHS